MCQVKISVNDVNLYESVKNWALPKSKDILPLSEIQECIDDLGKTSKETISDKIKRMLKNEIQQM